MAKKSTKTTKTAKNKKTTVSAAVKTKKTATKKPQVTSSRRTAKKPAKKLTAVALNKWHKWLAVLLAAQGVAIILLSTAKSIPVTTSFLTKDNLASTTDTTVLAQAVRHLFDVNLVCVVAGFLFIAALVHIIVATVYRNRYEKELEARVSRMRWAGGGIIAGLVTTTLALLVGVYDISALALLFGLVLIAALAGLAVEVYAQGPNRRRLAYTILTVSAVLPWVVLGVYLAGAYVYGSGNTPVYVYGAVGSMFVLFLAACMLFILQNRQKGKWSDYLFTERAFMALGFVAMTALAWQVYAGALAP